MIRFHLSLIWEGKTTYVPQVPRHLHYLAIAGAQACYASGPWGYILSQWIAGDFFTYGLHHLHSTVSHTVYPEVAQPTFCLHQLIAGLLRCSINQGMPVGLSPEWSQFFALPAKKRQEAFLTPGTAIAQHFDFRTDFLLGRMPEYPELTEIIEAARQYPQQAFAASAVVHTDFFKREWALIPEHLQKEKHPLRYLEYQSLRFLKEHCDRLRHTDVDELYEQMKGAVKRKDLEAVHRIKTHIDTYPGKPHTERSLLQVGQTNSVVYRTVFKKAYGQSPGDYLIQVKMELGYYLLTHTDHTVQAIAEECGYRTASHFGKRFKDTFGITPSSLRG